MQRSDTPVYVSVRDTSLCVATILLSPATEQIIHQTSDLVLGELSKKLESGGHAR